MHGQVEVDRHVRFDTIDPHIPHVSLQELVLQMLHMPPGGHVGSGVVVVVSCVVVVVVGSGVVVVGSAVVVVVGSGMVVVVP